MGKGNMCKVCGLKEKHPGYDYCGKTCARQARASSDSDLCENCHAKPKSPGYRHCGRTCANQAHMRKNSHGGDDHPPCLLCKTNPQSGEPGRYFCGSTCEHDAWESAPMLLELPKSDPKFNDILNQFDKSWRHPEEKKPRPPVKYIYRVIQPRAIWLQYKEYRNTVELRRGSGSVNQNRRWHGTTRSCNLGNDPKNSALCNTTGCALCSIIRTSYKVKLCNSSGRSFNRFGTGIYTSSTSSKAADYAHNNPQSQSRYRAIILNKVVLGKSKILYDGDNTLTGPPNGYDSITGKPGKELNYDEVVVYDDAAIVPQWLVVYAA